MLSAAVAVTALIAAAGAAQAAPRSAVAARDVSVERLEVGAVDFRDAAQVRAFHKRLQQAALFVCGARADAIKAERDADRACAEKAMNEAVNGLNRPLLTAYYQQSGAPMVARGY
jgi:UrcA family protein